MSLKKNIVANYASQIYVSALAIILLPTYLRMMGSEAYGLVGFFGLMQTWFGLLDMGLSSTMGRETARYVGKAVTADALRRLLRALEFLFIGVALLGVTGLMLGSDYLSHHWLKIEKLSYNEVSLSIQIMALIAALRWMGGLFRGVVNGFERQVWLSGYSAIFTTLRFLGVVPVLLYIAPTPQAFFSYQLIIALLELGVLVWKAYTLLPITPHKLPLQIDLKPILPVLKFSASISFLSIVWVLVTQTDKLILSKLISLSEYGLFTLAASAASAIMLFSGPISSAIQPRLARLHAEDNEIELITMYRKASHLVSVIVFPVAMILVFFSKQLLWIWTNNYQVSEQIYLVFSLYVLGNALLSVTAFQYLLQFAKGNMRLHMYGNIFFLIFLVPSIIFAVLKFGTVGAGYAWFFANIIFFLFWVPIVHHKFAKGVHAKWLIYDVGIPMLVSALATFIIIKIIPHSSDRIHAAFLIGIAGVIVLSITALSSAVVRVRCISVARQLVSYRVKKA